MPANIHCVRSVLTKKKLMMHLEITVIIEWINYYPGKESMEVAEKFGEFVGAPRMIKSWISKIYPGKTAPWHWDWDVDWKKYTEQGNPVRFTAMINELPPGHVFIVGDEALYNEKQGDVLQVA